MVLLVSLFFYRLVWFKLVRLSVLFVVLALSWSGNMIAMSNAVAFLNMWGVVKAVPQARPKTT